MAGITATVLAVAGLALGAFGQYQSMKAQKKAAKEAKGQARAQARRQRRQAMREAMIKQAQVENAGAIVGGSTASSAVQGGIGSIGSQLAGEIGFNTSMEQSQIRQAKYTQKASTWSAIGGLGTSVFSAANSMRGSQPQNTITQPTTRHGISAGHTAFTPYNSAWPTMQGQLTGF